MGRGPNKTVWFDKNAKINKHIQNWREANQIPDSFQPKNKLLCSVYTDRNSEDEVFITNIITKTESISDNESTLPSAFPAIVTKSKRAMAPLVSIYV